MPYPNRAPIRPSRLPHRSPPRLDPFYGYGYRPDWPSVVSVAHDEAVGQRVFVIMDRPCYLYALTLPLVIDDGSGSPLPIESGQMVAPVKLMLTMGGGAAVPHGAAWTWGPGDCQLLDWYGNKPNVGSGDCADTPGPYLPPASVIAANIVPGDDTRCTIQFSRAMVLNGSSPDSSMQFGGMTAASVVNVAADTLEFALSGTLSAGSAWEIISQPPFITTPVTFPQSGVF